MKQDQENMTSRLQLVNENKNSSADLKLNYLNNY